MYVCMYVCMHACMHACMYVCMYIYIYMYIYTHIHMYICMHAHRAALTFAAAPLAWTPFVRNQARLGQVPLAFRGDF